jgi:hypothetical protein
MDSSEFLKRKKFTAIKDLQQLSGVTMQFTGSARKYQGRGKKTREDI